MKLCYKVCISKCVEVDFQQIYDYIRTQNPNFSLEDIEWSFRDSVDYYQEFYTMLGILELRIMSIEQKIYV